MEKSTTKSPPQHHIPGSFFLATTRTTLVRGTTNSTPPSSATGSSEVTVCDSAAWSVSEAADAERFLVFKLPLDPERTIPGDVGAEVVDEIGDKLREPNDDECTGRCGAANSCDCVEEGWAVRGAPPWAAVVTAVLVVAAVAASAATPLGACGLKGKSEGFGKSLVDAISGVAFSGGQNGQQGTRSRVRRI